MQDQYSEYVQQKNYRVVVLLETYTSAERFQRITHTPSEHPSTSQFSSA